MVDINEELTRKVANLARLELTDIEIRTFTGQLKDILAYVDQLALADVSGVEPMTQPLELATAYREDQAKPFGMDMNGKPKVLASAPEVIDDGYKVPPIL